MLEGGGALAPTLLLQDAALQPARPQQSPHLLGAQVLQRFESLATLRVRLCTSQDQLGRQYTEPYLCWGGVYLLLSTFGLHVHPRHVLGRGSCAPARFAASVKRTAAESMRGGAVDVHEAGVLCSENS